MTLLRYGMMSTFHVYDILRPCTTDFYKHLHIIASFNGEFTRCMTCLLCSIIIWFLLMQPLIHPIC